ncbi:hypothetical protein PYCCODRAFT_1462982 [Trametes coccinea BRFM310]|uniref:Uncharacterized protein n=1 Tax=Trametes coccinea (strain BRFM310) TaxID=1353009 RepID=A0A1Y2J8K8_TRAC3|nr:hypothetical protein PYCCODRAFT_1462982 [Trametes coccinea BRFM310]
MSSQTVSQSTTVLQSLSNTASTLRRLISDNEIKVASVDSFTSSSFRPKWVSNRDAFFSIVDQSETSASKLAGTINYYLSLLGDVKDADLESEMIEELSALNIKLNGLNFDQSPDITALKSDFHQIAEELSTVFQERDATVREELEAAQTEVAILEKQLDEITAQITKAEEEQAEESTSSAKTYIGGVFSGSKKEPKADKTLSAEEQAKLTKAKTAEETAKAKSDAIKAGKKLISGLSGGKDANEKRRIEIRQQLSVAQAKLNRATAAMREREGINIDAILKAEKDIESSLDKLTEQLQVFPRLVNELNSEVAKYLAAFEAVQADQSPEHQKALAAMHHKTALGAAQWKKIVTLLGDVYAKKQK